MIKHLITRYIDGTGHPFEVSVHLYDDGLKIASQNSLTPLALYWDLNKIDLLEAPTYQSPGILSYQKTPHVQLMIDDEDFFDALTHALPHLKTRSAHKPTSWRTISFGLFVATLLTAFAIGALWEIEPKDLIHSLKTKGAFVLPSHE